MSNATGKNPKFNRNIILSIILLFGIVFSVIQIVRAVAPNPGHNFTEVSGGVVQGDLLYGSAADVLSALAKNITATRYLSNTGATNNPAWAQVDLTNGVTGILPTANGGTGIAFFTAAGPTIARVYTFPDAAATVLTTNALVTSAQGGTGIAFFTAAGPTVARIYTFPDAAATVLTSAAAVTAAQGGTGQAGGYTIGDLLYASGASALSKLIDVTAGSYLRSGGAGVAPVWSTPTLPNTATNRKVMIGNATNWVESTETYAVPGATAGNLMESDGTNWVSAVGGVLIGEIVKVTGNITYVPTAGTTSIVIRGVAGGGGGGGATGTASASSWAGGGASGGYFEKRFTGISSATTYTIAVGAGGLAGVAANGTGSTGSITTFACPAACTGGALTVTANGGLGGVSIAVGTSILSSMGGAAGAVSTNGDVNATGSPGEYALRFSATTGNTGSGAASVFGSGGKGSNAAGVGVTPVGFGGGGSGAASISTAANAGGAGAPGVLVILEFR